MAGGFFGGLSEGISEQQQLGLRRDALAQELGLRSRGLDLQERGLEQTAARHSDDVSLRKRALDISEQGQKNAQSRELLTRADKQVSDTLSIVNETITSGLTANKDPAAISKAIQPLVDSAKRVAVAGGLDPDQIDIKVRTWMARPSGADEAVGKVQSGVKAAEAVTAATGVPQREALQGQGVLRAEPRNSSTMESIRGKIAAGEPLTGGEQKVYDDALKADPLARFLALSQGSAAPAAPAASPAAPAASAETLPPAAAKQLKEGIVTTFANGQTWTLTNGKPTRVK
jgi:hypothetical protein